MSKGSKINVGLYILILFISMSCSRHTAIEYYVSPDGNDSNPGTIGLPFKSIKKAQQTVRNYKLSKNSLPSGIFVYIRKGIYPIRQTLLFTDEDSGTDKCPVVYRAYPGEEVLFIGGEVVDNFVPLVNETAITKIDKKYHGEIWEANLKSLGISDYGVIKATGSGHDYKPTALELFFNGEPMPLARYPNIGEWSRIISVPQSGEIVNKGNKNSIRFELPAGRHYGRFEYSGDRPSAWKSDDIWLHGYWTWDWADSYIKVDKIDIEKKEFIIAKPHHNYGYVREQRYYALNILEELDSPGEWYLDRTDGILYFWPPTPVGQGSAMVSILESLMVKIDKTKNLRIEGIVFECTRGEAICIEGGNHNLIRGCTVRNIGSNAIKIENGTYNGVQDCDIYNIGDGGILISGGNRKTLEPAHNFAINNHIHHYSCINKTYRPAISLNGVGNLMSHNYIHDAPHTGVLFGGNENILEYNEIHSIAKETGDVGAFYAGRDWTQRGNIIRYNYFHHLYGPGLHGVNAVYLDDTFCGTTIWGNIFYKAGSAAFVGGGHDNIVENNVFIECKPSIHLDARAMNWAKDYAKKGGSWGMYKKLEAVGFDSPSYSVKYPSLAKILDWGDPASPKGNIFRTNLSYGGKWKDIDKDVEQVVIENNYIEKEVPPFINPDKGKLYSEDEMIYDDIGFQKIYLDSIGLRINGYRKSLPEKNTKYNK